MSKCFLCNRDEQKVLLIRLPFETKYKRACLEIIGNHVENEYICLPCMGYEFDKAMDRLEREKA